MKTRYYIILPTIAFVLILSNAMFGHLIFASSYEQDINKYSVYVHLQPQWKSYPANILFDVTTVWNNPNPSKDTHDIYYDPDFSFEEFGSVNYNELQYIHNKPYVELKHQFSNCEQSWRPILYKYALDSASLAFQRIQGIVLNDDPYAVKFATIKNTHYDDATQSKKLKESFVQFIPICTAQNTTDFEYSIKINDSALGFDVYFVPSKKQFQNYLDKQSFEYYTQESCYGRNYQSYHGICKNVDKQAGLLILIPDELEQSLTKITISLHEMD